MWLAIGEDNGDEDSDDKDYKLDWNLTLIVWLILPCAFAL